MAKQLKHAWLFISIIGTQRSQTLRIDSGKSNCDQYNSIPSLQTVL